MGRPATAVRRYIVFLDLFNLSFLHRAPPPAIYGLALLMRGAAGTVCTGIFFLF
jgi:hypothetical protein